MDMSEKLRGFLDQHHVRYSVIPHGIAYTAREIAARAHVPGREFAKTVMVNGDGKHFMVVTTSDRQVHLDRFRSALGVRHARFEKENEFRSLFPECEAGAMPPFGPLYGVEVVVDDAIFDDDEISFNAGTHRTLIRMAVADFLDLVKPRRVAVTDPVH